MFRIFKFALDTSGCKTLQYKNYAAHENTFYAHIFYINKALFLSKRNCIFLKFSKETFSTFIPLNLSNL